MRFFVALGKVSLSCLNGANEFWRLRIGRILGLSHKMTVLVNAFPLSEHQTFICYIQSNALIDIFRSILRQVDENRLVGQVDALGL